MNVKVEEVLKDRECEGCGDKAEVDGNTPTPFGMFRAWLCLKCGFVVGVDNMSLITNIIKARAERRGVTLPVSSENMPPLLQPDGV